MKIRLGSTASSLSNSPAPIRRRWRALFSPLGFTHLGNHRSKNVRHYAQGDINFILNMEPAGQPADFRHAHGPSANGMAFRVARREAAFKLAVERGATPVEMPRGPGELDIPAIEGIGGSYLYLVDRYGAEQIYDVDFEPVAGCGPRRQRVGLHTLDHLTHNVNRGRMDHWAGFYEKHLQLPPDPLFRHRGPADRACFRGR